MGRLTSVSFQEVIWSDLSVPSFFCLSHFNRKTIGGLQKCPWKALDDKTDGTNVFAKLVNRQDAIANKIRFGGSELWKDESRAIA